MKTRITESVHDYKGYKIKLRYSTGHGGGSITVKVVGDKWINLRNDNWNFVRPDHLLTRAKDYIDNYPERLEEKFNRLLSEFKIKVEKNPTAYSKLTINALNP